MKNRQTIIKQTKHWLSSVVIELDLCPFAGHELRRNSIRYNVISETDIELCLMALFDDFVVMDKDDAIETALLIFPAAFQQFDEFLDYIDFSNNLLVDSGYEGVYQLATFHPDYVFSETDYDDASNFTNRSPYPMLHILRESSIERALVDYPSPEGISDTNIARLRKLGNEKMKTLFQASINVSNLTEK